MRFRWGEKDARKLSPSLQTVKRNLKVASSKRVGADLSIRLYFCGEVIADLLERNSGSGLFELLLGGSQFNAAIGASRTVQREQLGIGVCFVGLVSRDLLGERLFRALQEAEVDTKYVKRVDHNTGLAIVSISPGKENVFSYYGHGCAEQMTRIEHLPSSLGSGDDRRICCLGSISTNLEPARFAWLEFAKLQRESSLIIYDLNTRPSVARDPELYRRIVLDWARIAHVMKASNADIAWAYPGLDMMEVAAIWHSVGTSVAVFTKGCLGAEAHTRSFCVKVEAPGLLASDTVGAGDNFNAGLAIQFAKADCTTATSIHHITVPQLDAILHGANHTAACHLISKGARPL